MEPVEVGQPEGSPQEPVVSPESAAPDSGAPAGPGWLTHVQDVPASELIEHLPHLREYHTGKVGELAEKQAHERIGALRPSLEAELTAKLEPQIRAHVLREFEDRHLEELRDTDPVAFADEHKRISSARVAQDALSSAAANDAAAVARLDEYVRQVSSKLDPAADRDLFRDWPQGIHGRAAFLAAASERLAARTNGANTGGAAPDRMQALEKQIKDLTGQLTTIRGATEKDALGISGGGPSFDVGGPGTGAGGADVPTPQQWGNMTFEQRQEAKRTNPRIVSQIVQRATTAAR